MMKNKTIALLTATILTGSAFAGFMNTTLADQAQPKSVTQQQVKKATDKQQQKMFRNIKIMESAFTFTVKGEASLFEGTYQYAVKQGNKIVAKGFGTASKGGPEWGTFSQYISIPKSKLFGDKPMTLELFVIDQATGASVNKLTVPMNKIGEAKQNQVFRNTKVTSSAVVYTVKGEASLFEGTYQYAVKQGNKIVAKGFGTASKGGPEWGTFTQKISIPVSKLSGDKPLTVELFEVDQATGKITNKVVMPVK
ncbi:Gmad2 immunoglobulin-like domain-containing protein [Paenibacillus sp. N3/727]|uniref:Gmad2 immunoglobulin-like domain-containing protein n=1 Tax=Paenibacillus sp. N3/727 TaxID=2925845 RepID=UPI001F53C461|nr:Gmad2 immunoglobulin-like domain-containing protein [Paenibacillus sp. N3/727]UNK17146.1 Gmad2 immunoglobulin-like domain-containing protein [Paenibacillus sp. N3/727]